MYIMTFTTAFLQRYDTYNIYERDERDRFGILDTDDLVEDVFTLVELEEIIRKFPDIKIRGIKHNGSSIERLYCYTNNSHFLIDENLAFHYEQKTERGSFCTIRVYLKGTSCNTGCDLYVDTPHVEGGYDWDFKIKGTRGSEDKIFVTVSCTLRRKGVFSPSVKDLEILVHNGSCSLVGDKIEMEM